MKAIVVHELGPAEVMQYEEVPTPEPEADQIRVCIKASGVNPVDTYLRAGSQGYNPSVPYTPGLDGAGIIDAVGDEITDLDVESRVYLAGSLTGTYAEYALCSRDQIHSLPDHVSFAQGAGIHVPYYTAYRALIQRAEAKSGETVLVHGASGAVGIAAMQWAKDLGLRIIASASSNEGQSIAKEQGADLIVDHSNPAHYVQIQEFTNGHGVDVILEMMAHINLEDDLSILSQGGRVVVIGSRGKITITPRTLMVQDSAILGISLKNMTKQDLDLTHSAIQIGLKKQTLVPTLRDELSLADAATAHEVVMQNGACGKIILKP